MVDGTAFAEQAERYRHELRVHCYRMLGSFTDAEDLVQETLLRAWRRRETFEGRAPLRAWLYKIATNACLDALNGPARREVVAAGTPMAEVTWLEPFPDRVLDLVEEPDAAAIAKETVELAFLAAVQHLPPKQRAVLILRDVLGWPADDAAGALEMTVPALKSALQRARATLREHLPERRSDWAANGDAEARAVVRRYVEASERNDLAGLAALLREDARQTMPPIARSYLGRDAILAMWEPVLSGDGAWGEWRSVPTWANRQPAVVNYLRRDGETEFMPVNVDVLRIEDGLIAEITTFGPELLAAFGL
ncbi:RNA polymerase subunit sigma-70 [Actinomadura hibisca]|uniref:RNA polymerase subunit sigma-70 n=1 Tax=Actinomadura hibisca TaxID=68565 RepID=UPI00083631AB|nr:RNA polymerase subunit sigma-70 [Actinomadura hibisca]